MAFGTDLALLIRARYSLIYIPTIEEERVEKSIEQVAKQLENRPIYIWDFVDGYQGNPHDRGFGRRNPLQALEFIDKLSPNEPDIFILRDYHRFLEDVSVARKLRNLGRKFKAEPKNLIILAPQISIPNDLSEPIGSRRRLFADFVTTQTPDLDLPILKMLPVESSIFLCSIKNLMILNKMTILELS
jgi:hypothetical protein